MDNDDLLSQFRQAWIAGEQPQIEDYLAQADDSDRTCLLNGLVRTEVDFRRERGEDVDFADFQSRFDGLETDPPATTPYNGPANPPSSDEVDVPDLGRFQATRILGKGSFGIVYLAFDEELGRQVAVKVPHPHIENVEEYLKEARVLASLDHPGIVPVYDVIRTPQDSFVTVTKYIAGQSLDDLIARRKLTFAKTARIVFQTAEALHYAHTKGVYHRDIKPANILIDAHGIPYLVDFGLALQLDQLGKGPDYLGTPRYMSPEQARGDSNLLDGRSDIFSLGVVLYEMLTNVCPFQGGDVKELLRRIIKQEALPPRSIDDRIPQELERICLKALSKHMTDRYTTALDMATDLRKCMTYTPQPIDFAGALPASLNLLTERLAENSHDIWAQQRIAEGWEYGDVRNDARKMHPDLVPYDDLSESEKEYDRRTVTSTLKAILALGYEILEREGQDR